MGCHLGWYFTIGCPLKGGKGECIQKGLLAHQKQSRKTNLWAVFKVNSALGNLTKSVKNLNVAPLRPIAWDYQLAFFKSKNVTVWW
jgi:hypothetical protein